VLQQWDHSERESATRLALYRVTEEEEKTKTNMEAISASDAAIEVAPIAAIIPP
jgi:hypothetical protein